MRAPEIKEVKLKDNPFLLSLIGQGLAYQDFDEETTIKVAATTGFYNDWAAYFEVPQTPFGNVVQYGNKLPQKAAEELFPEWAKSGLKWRP